MINIVVNNYLLRCVTFNIVTDCLKNHNLKIKLINWILHHVKICFKWTYRLSVYDYTYCYRYHHGKFSIDTMIITCPN